MEGRGRLSSLDMLPEEAQEDLVWACQQLYHRDRTQADILFELNDRLAVKGVAPISRSAFNRKAVRLAASMRRMQETREIFSALSGQLQPDRLDEHSVALGEFLKQLIFDLLQPGAGDLDPDGAMKLARAFRDVLLGQKVSADRRVALQREFAAKAAKAIDTIAAGEAAAPDRAALLKRVREEIYGIMAP